MSRAKWCIAALAVTICIALVGGVVVFRGELFGSDGIEEWDPRVAPLAEWVERERGLAFDHPVPVAFLAPEEFAKASSSRIDLSDEEAADAERFTRLLRAVDGWGGDAYLGFERGGTTCARALYVGDTDADTDEMAAALIEWSAAMPAGTTSTTRTEEGVQMDACDPGPNAVLTFTEGYDEILGLPATRAVIAGQFLAQGASEPEARCAGQKLIDGVNLVQVAKRPELLQDPAFVEEVAAIVDSCRAGYDVSSAAPVEGAEEPIE